VVDTTSEFVIGSVYTREGSFVLVGNDGLTSGKLYSNCMALSIYPLEESQTRKATGRY
jgi:hypothetical protein